MHVSITAWAAVVAVILVMLAVDLFVFHRDAHKVTIREAAISSAIWVTCGLAFAVVVAVIWGGSFAGEYLAGYLIEKSLSVDNLFVFALLMSYFAVPAEYQHRVLFWGVLGALIFRAIFIAAGAAMLENFHWTIYLFGGFLVLTGIRMAFHKGDEVHPERNPVLKGLRKVMPMTKDYHGAKFFVKEGVKRYATPMLAVLIVIETTDIIFAVDSIPAIFAVTDEPFLVFTSNAFAILGLRALYFLLAGVMDRFVYLKIGLAIVLVFVGAKMLASEAYHMPTWVSLGVIAVVLAISIGASLLKTRNDDDEPASKPAEPDSAPEETHR